MSPRIKIHNHKGVHITFSNGNTISIQFGPGNYCDNYDMEISATGDRISGERGSATAEIAMWDANGHWYDFATGAFNPDRRDVKGYVSIDDLPQWIAKVAP